MSELKPAYGATLQRVQFFNDVAPDVVNMDGHWQVFRLKGGLDSRENYEALRKAVKRALRKQGIPVRTRIVHEDVLTFDPWYGSDAVERLDAGLLVVQRDWQPTAKERKEFDRATGFHLCSKAKELSPITRPYHNLQGHYWTFCPWCGQRYAWAAES